MRPVRPPRRPLLPPRRRGTTLLLLSVCAAFGAAFLAIEQHHSTASAGWLLAQEQRKGARLERELDRAKRRVAVLRSPSAALDRAAELGLVTQFAPTRLAAALPEQPSAGPGEAR